MSLQLPRLDQTIKIVTDKFVPSIPFHIWWQQVVQAIESAFNSLENTVIDIQEALDAANIAQAAADAAQASADAAQTAVDSLNIPSTSVQTITADYTVAIDDFSLFVDASSGNITISLPSADSGQPLVIKKIDASANTVTLDPQGVQKIDGSSTLVLTTQYEIVSITPDGNVQWYTV